MRVCLAVWGRAWVQSPVRELRFPHAVSPGPRSMRACQSKDVKREWRSVPACRRERELTHWVGDGAGGEKERSHKGEREIKHEEGTLLRQLPEE